LSALIKKHGSYSGIPPENVESERLLLRRPIDSDCDSLFQLNANPYVTRWLNWPTRVNAKKYRKDFSAYPEKWQNGSEYFWVIQQRDSRDLIGYLSSRRQAKTMDLGFVIDPRWWGKGLATEAASAMVLTLRELPGVEQIVAVCHIKNRASACVLRKSGFAEQGIARNFISCPNDPGSGRDAILFVHHCDDLDWLQEFAPIVMK